MIYIRKGKEPASLTEYKKDSYAYFDGCNKDDIRESLLKEQGYLCAYCMRRIDKKHMKIEHWYPEERLSEREKLEYKNMLGTCEGHVEGKKGKTDTCDAHKGSQIIKVNPCNETTLKTIKYKSSTGEICADDPDIQNDLNHKLNLNSPEHYLKMNRKAKLDSVIRELSQRAPKGTWTKDMLSAFLDEYTKNDSEGKKKEYLGIVIWYIKRKLM